jgi:hypothetical protein
MKPAPMWLVMLALGAPAGAAEPTLASAPQAAARPAAEDTLQEVTVTAQRQRDRATLKALVPSFIDSHADPATITHKMARWNEPVCATTRGLPEPYDGLLTQRLVALAARIGAPVDPHPGCQPNIEIVFTTQAQAELDLIAKNRRDLLGFSWHGESLTTFNRPIKAWYVTGTRTVSGESRLIIDTPLNPPIRHKRYDSGSRLRSSVRSELVHVLVIADANRIGHAPLSVVADYIAMLALTRVASLDACNALPSILDLFSSGCAPARLDAKLADADLSYLRALYALDLELTPVPEHAELFDRMVNELAGN